MVTVDEIVRAVNAALDGCEPSSAASSLLQTGQVVCDQGEGNVGPCGSGSPAGQDGAVRAGTPRGYTDQGDGTIADNATGLVWEKLSDDDGIHDRDMTFSWDDAFQLKIATLNAAPCFADHCDWRLPNRRELESLVDAGRVAPAVDAVFETGCEPSCQPSACSCTQLDQYWSSTSYLDDPSFAWAVDHNLGAVNGFEKSLPLYVRAVRGGV